MKFFETYFTKHHFFHTPHKWFLAFLISPIHAAEMHYKKKYHLNFIHARKLFLFDMTLLFSIFLLAGATIFWFLYDPTIEDLVNIEIVPISHTEDGLAQRIASGERVSYAFLYSNYSEETALVSPALALHLPDGFIVDSTEPAYAYDGHTKAFALEDVAARSSGEVRVHGRFFGEPDKEVSIGATLSYRQEARDVREQKHVAALTTLRGSTLQTETDFPEKILSQGTSNVSITIKNTGTDPIHAIFLPLQIDQELRLEAQKTSLGTLDREAWRIEALGPNESATLDAALIAGINTGTREKTVEIAPRIQIDDRVFAQQPDVHVLVIEHPEISLSATWEDEATALAPGDTKTLHIRLTNTSNTHFENISVSIPVDSSVIDIARLRQLNQGIYSEGRWRTTHNYAANLAALAPGQSTNLDVRIPIRSYPQGGVDLRLSLPTQIGASVSGVDGATYEASAESPTIRIGSNIFLGAEARYYTNEGDQLGRGPLPPQVGKETKYWAMFTISNGTSRATDLQFSAKLAPHVEWTGRSSVSHGKNVSFNPSTRTVSWSHNTLAPQEQAGIYFELALTPSASQIGAHPTLVQNIALSAYDTYTENQIQTSAGAIDTSIPNDSVGRQKGTAVR